MNMDYLYLLDERNLKIFVIMNMISSAYMKQIYRMPM